MEILVYTNKLTSRKQYCFKQVCNRILGLRVSFTTKIEEFIAFESMKFSYAKKPLGQELFVEAYGLLDEEGFGDFEVKMDDWNGTPCFFKVSKDSTIPFDIFSASFYLLTRYEEYLPFVKDSIGGFPVEESTAFEENFLNRPVVDLWAFQFLEFLKEKYTTVDFPSRSYNLGVHIAVHEAFAFRYKGMLRQIVGFVNQLFIADFHLAWQRIKTQLRLEKDPYNVYDDLIEFAKQEQVNIKMFFQLSDFSKVNRNINHHKTHYQRLIKSMGDYFPIGLLPGANAIQDITIFKKEKQRWKEIVKQDTEAVLLKKFPLSFPESYINFEKAFIKQDYSMGYMHTLGFRAGTCTPFLFYNLNTEETTPLKISPYVFNSEILENTAINEIRNEIQQIKRDVIKVNGSLNITFENTDFVGRHKQDIHELINILNVKN